MSGGRHYMLRKPSNGYWLARRASKFYPARFHPNPEGAWVFNSPQDAKQHNMYHVRSSETAEPLEVVSIGVMPND